MRVLIVEDDASTRELLAACARERHHEVLAYPDAESVWAALSAGAEPGTFDLAVVDIGLPGQDGVGFCRQFRRHTAGRHAILVLVTADGGAGTLEAALEAGAHDYVLKPIDRRHFGIRLAIAEGRSLAYATSRYSREALRESEHRFEAFMNNSPTLAFIRDAQGRYLYVNRRYLDAFRIGEADRIGRTVQEVLPPETADAVLAVDREVLQTGRARECVHRTRGPEGVHDWLTYAFPLADSSGQQTLVAGIAIDVTARIEATEELRRQKARAEALLEIGSHVSGQHDLQAVLQAICEQTRRALGVAGAAVFIHDAASRTLRLASMSGGPEGLRERLEPAPASEHLKLGPPDVTVFAIPDLAGAPALTNLRLAADAGVRSVAVARMLHDGELTGIVAVGELEPREFSADDLALLQGVADQGGVAIRSARLLEQQRRAEEQMRNAQKLESLGVLAGGIAHDFNNLLVGVLGNAGLALLELPDDSPARQAIRDIEISAQRAAELTRQMLAYSGRGTFRVEPVDVSTLVEEMSQLLRRVISKQAQLSLHLDRALPAVVGDATQLRQVVMNLITNASDALDERQGTIRLETGVVQADRQMLASTYLDEELPEGEYVCIEVSDTGVGMDAATAARLFDPFFTTKFTGRGLGLAAVLGIVRGHRGAISLQSAPGKGTTFRVLLPAAQGVSAPTPAPPASTLARGSGRVLLVDDEEAVRGLARRVLERGGFDVVEAQSGEEALARYEERPDTVTAVVLDLTMPGLGGEATFHALRRTRPDLPIVLSSGYMPEEGDAFSGVAFLAKPYRPAELVDAVNAAIERVRVAG
jgi:PAS domain S-box-containing protein